MSKVVTGFILAFLLTSCARMVLPEDTRIIAPAIGVPAGLARYSGSWEGYMGGRKYKTIIEEIRPPRVKAVFAWAELQGSA
jgi:hypothetical protein